jgi:hypothetical protein
MQTFYDRLNDAQESINNQNQLIQLMKAYINETTKPFSIANVQIKFGLGYQRACNLINYFIYNSLIIKNSAGQYLKLHNGLTINNLQGIN